MTTVDQNTSTTGLGLAQSGANGSSTAQGLQDQFLKLLVTQLQNQDPLNPMQNAELTSQLAQISTVEGINNLKNTMLAISGQIDVSQSMNAVAMIGKGVLIPGTKVKVGVDGDNAAERVVTPYGLDLQGDAQKVQVRISDSNGAVVRTIEMGEQKTGVYTLNWDGKNDSGVALDAGAYTVSVLATDGDGKKVNAEVLSYGQVKSVAYSTNGLRLDLGLDGQTSMLDVRKVIGA
ncbi:flagellar basal body rod modification protein [Achromobacter marplatensis]|jgi:flagellar basal-body rod modification protein FlgD|uniref:Basal-body rod modification protein FlgD n=1 Tax=Achromobacter marplatensis TaxID=470868 RepID=J4PBD1_9BURK|nr:flagellar hook capping FlgD N-terminal domain-containing protein [Achromobacter marplatensis]EJO31122.1 flagellar basal body rod modification protein [Achromobacter marplatensis]MDH2053160.1 flagellar hook assembly protein FlgD [Achromobacter marplatensis]OWT69638.1 flagellar basal body rod modification protein [Achromobacter marplatensis]RBP23668.1 flagellar basal-body rod modification protein FlgD [Achromobacter marplatensis]CAB3630785.1 Basal-body rod modification protein FlgD [Achromoba